MRRCQVLIIWKRNWLTTSLAKYEAVRHELLDGEKAVADVMLSLEEAVHHEHIEGELFVGEKAVADVMSSLEEAVHQQAGMVQAPGVEQAVMAQAPAVTGGKHKKGKQ